MVKNICDSKNRQHCHKNCLWRRWKHAKRLARSLHFPTWLQTSYLRYDSELNSQDTAEGFRWTRTPKKAIMTIGDWRRLGNFITGPTCTAVVLLRKRRVKYIIQLGVIGAEYVWSISIMRLERRVRPWWYFQIVRRTAVDPHNIFTFSQWKLNK